jgi:GTP-binding protein
VVQADDRFSFVAADIPGLLEGAHKGTGLGDKFLRHIERTKLLLHLIDLAGVDGRDPIADYQTINQELKLYSPALAKKPQIVVLNKIDLPQARENLERVKGYFQKEKVEVLVISAATHQGLKQVLQTVSGAMQGFSPAD